MKYGNPRVQRRDAAMYQTFLNIIHVGSYHPEGKKNTEVARLFSQLEFRDQSYVDRPYDKSGMDALKAMVGQNRAKMVRKGSK